MSASPRPLQIVLAVLLLFSIAAASAGESRIYRTVDEDGTVSFTDIPPRDDESAEQVVIETPNSFDIEEAIGPREEWIVDSEDEGEEPAFSYRSLAIKSPQDDEPIRDNAGNVAVVAVAKPRLQRGHKMRLLLDGQPVQEGYQTDFKLLNVDRGTHSLATEIIDKSGAVLIRSDTTTFHLLRISIITAPGRPTPAGP